MNKNKKIIYLVDDDAAVLDSLKVLLESIGKTVVIFESGEKFLAAADLNSGGVLVLDINMPGMSGLDVLDHLAARKSDIAVIVISGRADKATKSYAASMGVAAFLDKPIRLELLDEAVHQASLGKL